MRSYVRLALGVLGFVGLVGLESGCGQPLTPAQNAQIDRVKCEVQALEPLALADANTAVGMIEDGRVGLEDAIAATTAVKANVDAVRSAFKSCRAQFPKLAPDAGAAQ